MEITILQENLIKGLSIADKFASSKSQLPILTNILLSTENNKLKLSATNLETGINYWLPAKIEKQGQITIPSKIISEFVSSLPADKVSLKEDKNRLEIVCRNYRAVLNAISAEEFPPIPSLKSKKTSKDLKKIRFKSSSFVKAINQVAFTAAVDESRPVLTGVRLGFLNKKIQMVATDGYRLSLKTLKTDKKLDLPTLIISAQALQEVARIAGQEENKEIILNLTNKEKQAIFSFDEIEIISRLIEGDYPDFEKIIPEDQTSRITIDKEEFLKAVKTAAIFARDSANIIRFKVQGSRLKVMSNTPEVGENEIEIEVKKQGKDTKIAFNCRFLLDYLNTVLEDQLVLETSGPLKPGVFKSIKDPAYLHLIMPVRLQE